MSNVTTPAINTRPRACASADRLMAMLALFCIALAMGGCGMKPKVDARHKLPDGAKVAVVVNDPRLLLGDRRIANTVAEVARRDLHEQTGVADVLPTLEVENLRTELGDEFDTLAIDAVGRRLGVDQVVHVFIEEVDWQRSANLIRPRATARVKVIDVAQSTRAFPAGRVDRWADPGRVTVELPHVQMDRDWRGSLPLVQNELARQIGRTVARLFYSYHASDKI